jgi:prepilin-type N-terminal cleavage/methylation domain-containing protein
MNVSKRHKRARGVTLVELLVVVTILLMLAAFAIPTMRGLTEGRKVREAARAIDVFLAQQKTRAVELQRPVGVELQRFTAVDSVTGETSYQDDVCTVLRAVEIPPPYAGDTVDARIKLVWNETNKYWDVSFLPVAEAAAMWSTLVQEGDLLQLNYQGKHFTIAFVGGDKSKMTLIHTPTGDGVILNKAVLAGGLPFQVTRQPQLSAVAPLRLPRDTVIDLADSGYYDSPTDAFAGGGLYPDAFGLVGNPASKLAADHRGPLILFAPNGSIATVYHWFPTTGEPKYQGVSITKPIFLMVGKFERTGNVAGAPVKSLAEDGLHNWQDATNLWIAASPFSGLVTTAEVNAPFVVTATGLSVPGDPNTTDVTQLTTQMQVSRQLAREAQISKGAL